MSVNRVDLGSLFFHFFGILAHNDILFSFDAIVSVFMGNWRLSRGHGQRTAMSQANTSVYFRNISLVYPFRS